MLSQFDIAYRDTELTGDLRLAFMSVGDSNGFVHIPSVMSWCNCTEAAAEEFVQRLAKLDYLSWVTDLDGTVSLGNVMMLNAVGYFDKRPPSKPQWTISQEKREEIYERDSRKCVYCSSKDSLTIDHMTPRSRGGSDDLDNLVTCCKSCNSRKGTKTYAEYLLWLEDSAS